MSIIQVGIDAPNIEAMRIAIGKVPGLAVKYAKIESWNAVQKMAKKLRDGIKKQTFKSFKDFPLSRRYLAWKQSEGLDQRVLIATGLYLKAIKAMKIVGHYKTNKKGAKELNQPETGSNEKENKVAYVVTLPDAIHPPTRGKKGKGIPYKVLAAIHEFGAPKNSKHKTIPPRPTWGPTWKEFVKTDRKDMVKKVKKQVLREVRKMMKKKGKKT